MRLFSPATMRSSTRWSLLLINQRLLGFRFAADRGEIWVQEEFPVELLNDDLHVYIHHVIEVLSTVIPSILPFFESHTRMSDDDIDAVFGRIEATAAH